MITTALPEEALYELLELTGANLIGDYPGNALADPRSIDEDDDLDIDDDEDDDEDDDDDEEDEEDAAEDDGGGETDHCCR